MILKRFYDEKLSQASYLIGCAATGEAVVIDANRDVQQYLEVAAAEGVRITHVTETHIHADYVSGSRELAERAGARLLLSDEGGEGWRYAFADAAGATLLRDGDEFRIGNVRLAVRHTPGHTPEHVVFLVTDGAVADRPIGVVTGDFVFVGDVGRPDLLERAAGVTGSMESGARQLFRSLSWFRTLPDYLQIWPGHGAGSACGKGLSAIPTSTVGYERLFNPAFQQESEEAFVRWVLEGQPEPPRYFAEMKRINRDGPRLLGGFGRPERLPGSRLAEVLEAGTLVVDTRPAADFAAGHVPGTINIPLDRSFTTWAGWLLPYGADFHLLVDERSAHGIDEAVRDLAMIGLDRVAGSFGVDAIGAWREAGRPLRTTGRVEARELAGRLERGEVEIVDVRSAAEWESGRVPEAPNLPLGQLTARLGEIAPDRPVVVYCQSGARSAIGASLLQAHGFPEVANLAGGFQSWEGAGLPVERGTGAGARVGLIAGAGR